MSNDDELIGSAQAAQILQRSQATVHRLVKSEELDPVDRVRGGFAGVFVFRRSDVERLARQRGVKAADKDEERAA